MYGLLGRRLGHSFSPQIHAMLGDYEYRLIEKEPEELEDFFRERRFSGINVTIPYKKTVVSCLDRISPEAQKIGSVNTVTLRDGKLTGDNTDYHGFLYMVKKSGISVAGKKVLLLGSGGASLTAAAVLRDLRAGEIVVVSRSGKDNYTNLDRHGDARIIVNTTPVGMYPDNLKSAVDIADFPNLDGVLDIVYNPLKTKLILDAERLGIPFASGLSMLVAQAKKANEIFFGRTLDDGICDEIEKKLVSQMQNIVLVGMAGCGKSTVGRELAKRLDKELADTDSVIEKQTGRKIPDIIKTDGEDFFRGLEARAIADLGKEKGMVLATGGGAVTREENLYPLRQNGVTVFINRDPDSLPTEGRPLSQREGTRALFEKRLPLYRRFADIEVNSAQSVEKTAELIIKELEKYENSCH